MFGCLDEGSIPSTSTTKIYVAFATSGGPAAYLAAPTDSRQYIRETGGDWF